MKKCIVLIVLGAVTILTVFGQEKPDALAMYYEGRYEDAIQVCLDELKELPRNMDSYAVMCWSLIELKKYQDSFDQVSKALAMAPYDPRIVEVAGESLYFLGKNREALKYFEQYIFISRSGLRISRVYYYMGEIFIRLGEYNNADIAFSTALHFDEQIADWWSRLGYAREMGEQYEWAVEAYENALRLNPNLDQAKNGLASVKKKME